MISQNKSKINTCVHLHSEAWQDTDTQQTENDFSGIFNLVKLAGYTYDFMCVSVFFSCQKSAMSLLCHSINYQIIVL